MSLGPTHEDSPGGGDGPIDVQELSVAQVGLENKNKTGHKTVRGQKKRKKAQVPKKSRLINPAF